MALGGFQAVTSSPIASGFQDEDDDISKALEVTGVSFNPVGLAMPKLDRRISCVPLDRVVRSIGTRKMTVAFILPVSAFAHGVCAYFNGQNCITLTYLIQSGTYLVYMAAAYYSGSIPEGLPMRRDFLITDPRD